MSNLMNPEHIFSNIWATPNGDFEKSSGEAWEVIDTDFAAELTPENRQTLKTFLATAAPGDSVFIEGVLILRERDDFELSFDVETIPAETIREKFYHAKQQFERFTVHLRNLKTRDLKTYAYPNAVEFHTYAPGGGSHLCWHCSRHETYFLHEEPYATVYSKAVQSRRKTVCPVCRNQSDAGETHWDCELLGREGIAKAKQHLTELAVNYA